MAKRLKTLWAFFIEGDNRRHYNSFCLGCRLDCKQSFRVEVVSCPKRDSKLSASSGKPRAIVVKTARG
ncbi:MAG: hypothetical protein LBC35_07815 [Coriobacteriales bacterium]|nr:hypothetical protein [Coriobacteriales bacterium]